MNMWVFALQVALAAVMGVAGIAKLRDQRGSSQAMRDFGVAERLASPFGLALPIVEVALAALLLIGTTARWAALVSALLLLVFIVAIAENLRQGRQPDCHCFGQLYSEPTGWSTIIRNSIFIVVAIAIVWNGGIGLVEWAEKLGPIARVGLVLAIVISAAGAVQSWFLMQLVRQNRALLTRIESLAVPFHATSSQGTADISTRTAPDFDLPTLDGERLSLQGLLAAGKPVLLAFTDPNCGPCNALLPDIGEWQRRFGEQLVVAMISRGAVSENKSKASEHGLVNIALQKDWEVYTDYGIRGTPSAVLVQPDGTIHEAFAGGRDQIRDLVIRSISRAQTAPRHSVTSLDPGSNDPFSPTTYLHVPEGPEVGTSGMRLPLPDLDGNYVSLDDYLGNETIVVFWNVDCGFCQRMLPEFQEWEQRAGDWIDRVLVISAGPIADNKKQGIRSRIVIDDGFTAGNSFGATGTPSAILLDKEGRVASPLAVGNDALLHLLDETTGSVER